MSRPEGDSNHQPSDPCRMLLPLELSGPDICCPMYLSTDSGDIEFFKVKLTFEVLTVHINITNNLVCQYIFSRYKFNMSNNAPGKNH